MPLEDVRFTVSFTIFSNEGTMETYKYSGLNSTKLVNVLEAVNIVVDRLMRHSSEDSVTIRVWKEGK